MCNFKNLKETGNLGKILKKTSGNPVCRQYLYIYTITSHQLFKYIMKHKHLCLNSEYFYNNLFLNLLA